MSTDAGDPHATRALDTAAPVVPLGPGAVVNGWEVVDHVADGGFGSVYRVVGEGGRAGALKMLHAHLASSGEMVARFVRETELIARLRHPAIVELIASGVADSGAPYLVMELLEGEDLAARLTRRGRLAPVEALAVLGPLCEALTYAHQCGVVHRDIKASNVFLDERGPALRVVLLDFGVAKLVDALALDLTATRQSLGTPACMAPEQIRGEPVDARTDVYGLAGLAYHGLTGRMPFDDPSVTMIQYLHLHARRPRASSVAPLPPRLDAVIARGMAIDPAERYASPLELYAALRDVLVGATPGPLVERDDAIGLLVTTTRVGALDDAALEDLERVLPAAERWLGERGFVPALDLGESLVFVHRRATAEEATATALALDDHLAGRPGRTAAVAVSIVVHRGAIEAAGDQIRGGDLVEPHRWGDPGAPDGVWATSALLVDAYPGERLRRLR